MTQTMSIIKFFIVLIVLSHTTFSDAAEVELDDNNLMFMEDEVSDPFEKVNRVMFNFNTSIDKKLFRPLARQYSTIDSNFLSKIIHNFSDNLHEPSNFINAILQGEPQVAIRAFWRFYINSIVGLGGAFEIAESMGISKVILGFEDTMVYYGIERGPYIILPFYKPLFLRGVFALALEALINPLFYIIDNTLVSLSMNAALLVPQRAQILNVNINSGIDPYAKLRSIFEQKVK